MPGPSYQFGDFELDCGRFELRRKGHSLRVERKPMELLILLASSEGRLVTRTEIAQHLWSREVFVDTEHGINTAIRKLRYLLRDDPEDPRFIQTVTGKGYRLIAPVTSISPPSESNPAEEAGNTHPAQATESSSSSEEIAIAVIKPPHPSELHAILPKPWFAIPAILLVFSGVFYGTRFLIHRHELAAANIHSLAVLPLDNLSGDPNQDYFADGMTDELTTMLAKDSTLRIVSRTSVMQYKKAHRPLREIAHALGVDGIVEGSVVRSAGRVHMTLQVIQADADSHLWAESYDRDADDIALPDEAAQAIAKRLHSTVSLKAPLRYVNPAAHDAYLQGKYLWFSRGRMGESKQYFEKSIEIQPDYAMGWAWLSNFYGGATFQRFLDPRTSLDPMQEAANRAMQIDPNLAESHMAMAAALWLHRWDFSGADQEVLRAISLDPNDAELYLLRAMILVVQNRTEDAIEAAKKSMEINPFERPWALMNFYVFARRFDDAIRDGKLRLKDYPADPAVLGDMSYAYWWKGNYKEAVEYSARIYEANGDPQSAVSLRRAYTEGGPRSYIRRQLAEIETESKSHYVSPVDLAAFHAMLGEKERTMALLYEGYNQHSPIILYIQTDPEFDFLHSDPRYRALVKKIGLPPAW